MSATEPAGRDGRRVAEVATISARFPALPAVFTAAGLDASLPSPIANPVYLFHGDQCVPYDLRASNPIAVKMLAATWSGPTEIASIVLPYVSTSPSLVFTPY